MRISRDRAVYVISVAAELAGVHPQTLRIYERKGLLDPARTGGGSRRYSDADIARLQRIQELTTEGLNLAGVKRVLELEEEARRLQSELDRLGAELTARVEATHRNTGAIWCPSTSRCRSIEATVAEFPLFRESPDGRQS
jgi:MerR family transcriptional regulator/heat shock protein HspR